MYPTSQTAEGIQLRAELFENRIKNSAMIAKFFNTPLSDMDELSIEEYELLFEQREDEVERINKSMS